MNRGFVVIWRKFKETSFFRDSYAVHLAILLLLKCNHKDLESTFNGEKITVLRGQCIVGRNSLSEDSGIKPSTVRNKLELLKKIGFLDIKSNNRFSIVTVRKYNTYQNVKTRNGQPGGQPADNQGISDGQPQDNNLDINNNTNKQLNKDNNETNKYNVHFDQLWLKYPKRVGRKGAFNNFKTSVKSDQDLDSIKLALDNYLESERVLKGFIQNGATWFNNWKDWINFKEPLCPKCKGKGTFTSSTGYDCKCDCPKGRNT